jgi:hypothetical protein
MFAGIVNTRKLSLLGNLFLEISAMLSQRTQLEIGKGTPGLRFISMTIRFLQDLFKALEDKRSRLLDAIRETIRIPYKSTIAVIRGQIAKL